ncbi:hypothetical protein DOY81_004949 [Sarcophaga bullata]|nr:hypothetical protein DOY81_004949 [Sarcophaga bullata]
MDTNIAYISRPDILNFPFPYKLWLVIHLEYCDFLRWNRDGTVILLDLVSLEDYLNSNRSIFKIKNSSQFLEHLEEYKFERLNATPEAEEDLLLQYKNDNFQRHRLDLLAKIRRHSYQLLGDMSSEKQPENVGDHSTAIPKRVSDRMLGDLCFMSHGGLSRIKKSRIRFQTMLHFYNETRILKEKLLASDAGQRRKSRSDVTSNRSSVTEEDQVIELPVELFENPHDSVLNLGEDFRPEYAGYYGNCSKEQISRFFGDYLPKYEDGSMEVRKIVADNSTDNGFNASNAFNNSDPNIIQYYPTNIIENNPNISVTNTDTGNSIINLNFSSNLEPIFKTTESNETIHLSDPNGNNTYSVTQINANNFDTETDIAMEEFIKFKDKQHQETFSNNTQEINETEKETCKDEETNEFPQMPAAVKMEITEDVKENEANFRNFFSQYRASLNLLYERQ